MGKRDKQKPNYAACKRLLSNKSEDNCDRVFDRHGLMECGVEPQRIWPGGDDFSDVLIAGYTTRVFWKDESEDSATLVYEMG